MQGGSSSAPFIFLLMKRTFLILWCAALAASLSLSQTHVSPAKKTAPKTVSKTGTRKVASSKKAPVRTSAGPTKRSAKKGSLPRTPVRARQTTPTTDRYREIQQALVAKGYLKQEPNGTWGTESSDALRQFQTENKLSPTGKLSSQTLISLGLGPKFSDTPVVPMPVVPMPVPAPER